MLKKPLIIATCITLTLFGIILYIGTLYGQYMPGDTSQYPPKNQGKGSRAFEYEFLEIGSASTYTLYYGTQSVTGSGTAGRITGTSSALPHIEYNYAGGTPTFNFVGATLQNEGVDVTVDSDLTGYIAVSGGTGTGNVLTNPTLAGAGTISANVSLSGNITANSLLITPTELGYLNNATSEIQSQITTATGSITGHTHTGADGTTQISHNSVIGTGTNSHTTIDTFIASKAQASGLASLDSNSLVVENPASGTTTPTASKIPIADGSGKIADGWLNSTITALGQTIELGTETTGNTDNVAEGDSNLYYLDSRVNAAVGSLSVSAHSDVIFTSPAEGHKLVFDSSLNVVNATDTAIVAWSGITGIPTDNGSVSVTSGAGYIPVAGGDGKLDYGWQKDVIRLTGTTTEQLAGAYGQLYVQRSVGGGVGGETVLLLHMDNPGTSTFVDSSSYAKTITANGDTTGTTTAKFGSGGGYFDGTGDYLSFPTDSTTSLDGDFTLEGWAYPLATPSNGCLWGGDSDGSNMRGVQIVAVNGSQIDILIANSAGNAWQINPGTAVNAPTIVTGAYTHWAMTRAGTSIRFYWGGSLIRTGTTTSNPINNGTLYVGARNNVSLGNYWNGNQDEVSLQTGTALYTSYSFTPPTVPNVGGNYTQYSAKYDDPVNGNTILEIKTPGTATTQPSYVFLNGSGTIIGAGTTTGIVDATSTVYALHVDGSALAGAWQVTSTKSKKENIMPMHIKPEQLEAETVAKPLYIKDKKPAWIVANEVNYTYVGTETGTGTVTYVDSAAMEADYATHIELEWATDLNQSVYVEAVQVAQEKYFWNLFDTIQPKSWTPAGMPDVDRKGFVVEEMPDVIKGDNGLSIDPMKLIAYITLVVQELKDAAVINFEALEELLSTGTITNGELINNRLEVMRTAQ